MAWRWIPYCKEGAQFKETRALQKNIQNVGFIFYLKSNYMLFETKMLRPKFKQKNSVSLWIGHDNALIHNEAHFVSQLK